MNNKPMDQDRPEQEPAQIERRDFLVKAAVAVGGLLVWGFPNLKARAMGTSLEEPYDWTRHYWGFAVDTTKCIGCNACVRACRAENNVPEGQYRTWIERYEIDENGKVHVDVVDENTSFTQDKLVTTDIDKAPRKAFFVPKLCNHCERSVCTQVCPVGASYATKDGVVLVDQERCIGCGYCVQACPYGSRFINKVTHTADKCTLCYHRITKGLLPACVQVCPVGARVFGDMNDPDSDISRLLRGRRYALLKPELGTHPKCYYVGLDVEVH